MKTICPHCKQEFPETPDEYLGMTLQCSVCQKEFVCEKPKFCSECGTSNPSNAIKCSQCGKFLPVTPPQQQTIQNTGAEMHNHNHVSVEDDDCFFEEVDWTTAWKKFAIFSGRSRPKEYILFGISLLILDIIVSLIMLGVSIIIFVLGHNFISQRELKDAVITVGVVCLTLAIYVSGQGVRQLQAEKVKSDLYTADKVETITTEHNDV